MQNVKHANANARQNVTWSDVAQLNKSQLMSSLSEFIRCDIDDLKIMHCPVRIHIKCEPVLKMTLS